MNIIFNIIAASILILFFAVVMYARYKMRPRCPSCHRNVVDLTSGECRRCHNVDQTARNRRCVSVVRPATTQ